MISPFARSIRCRAASSPARCPASTSRSRCRHDEVAAIEAGMDRYAVLVFHDQQHHRRAAARVHPQLRRDRAGDRRHRAAATSAGCRLDVQRRLQPRQGRQDRWRATTGGGCSTSATGCGTPTARSSAVPAKYSLLSARQHPVEGRQHRVRRHARGLRRARRGDQGARSRTWSASTRRSSRAASWASPTSPTRSARKFKPVRQRLVRTPSGDRAQVALPVVACRRDRRLAGAGGARLPARPDRARDAARFVYAHDWRRGDLVMWDNRADHAPRAAASTTREVRDMRRTTVAGEQPTMEQAA